jgi:thiol-disulfide isomerase/thioredoxin
MKFKFAILFTVVAATFGISSSFSVRNLIQYRPINNVASSSINQAIGKLRTSRAFRRDMTVLSTDDEIEVVNEIDEDFLAMKKEIDALIAGPSGSSSEQSKSLDTLSSVGTDAGGSAGLRKWIATASAIMGGLLFFFQHSQPVNSVALLKAMERDSMDFSVALCNGKPTLVEFYADWCESCKAMAPTMRSIETQYKDRINFITIDGSSFKNGMFEYMDHDHFLGRDNHPHGHCYTVCVTERNPMESLVPSL